MKPNFPEIDEVVDLAIDLMQMESIEDAVLAVEAALTDLRVSFEDYNLYLSEAAAEVERYMGYTEPRNEAEAIEQYELSHTRRVWEAQDYIPEE